MYREIKIGEVSIPMKATAATALRYRHVFGQDLMTELQDSEESTSLGIDTVQKLAFVMACAADPEKDMTKLNEEVYIEWLDKFEPLDLAMATQEIVDLYLGNTKGLSEVKKKAGDAVKRKLNTALYTLRCVQVGLTMADLDVLDYGFVMDILAESSNDDYKYRQVATQADFDNF